MLNRACIQLALWLAAGTTPGIAQRRFPADGTGRVLTYTFEPTVTAVAVADLEGSRRKAPCEYQADKAFQRRQEARRFMLEPTSTFRSARKPPIARLKSTKT